jgi:hypothetical protein
MKLCTQTGFACCSFWLVAQLALLGVRGEARAQQSVSDLPASERLIATFQLTNALPIPANVSALLEWPTAEILSAPHTPSDRSKTILPLFRQPGIHDAKPTRLGAQTPQAAAKEAEQWVRRVLKPEWVPNDLAARLRPLRREPASQSIIICRYLIDGHAIQIDQSRGSMWIIIRPLQPKPLSKDGKELADATFHTYFLNGDRMAALPGKETAGTAKLRVWLPDFSASIPPGALANWWGWRLWLTDGEAVAILLDKTSEDSAHTIMPDDPWF